MEPLRIHNSNGIYQATTFGTQLESDSGSSESGAGGYFGVQWKGASYQNDMLLYSVWDKKVGGEVTSYALPMLDGNCARNCNDCAVHGDYSTSTGTKCYFNLPQKMVEGDELQLKIEREPVEETEYMDAIYSGHVWKVSLRYVSGPRLSTFMEDQFGGSEHLVGTGKAKEFVIGRVLFSDPAINVGDVSAKGIRRLALFHEHLGCTPCGSFGFEAERSGPYITETAEMAVAQANGMGADEYALLTVPQLLAGDASFNCPTCSCDRFDAKSSEWGKIRFLTGMAGLTPHWDTFGSANSESGMYWTDNGHQYVRDEPEPITTTIESTTTTGECASLWAKCGGSGWKGPSCCVDGSYCHTQTEWYHQCMPVSLRGRRAHRHHSMMLFEVSRGAARKGGVADDDEYSAVSYSLPERATREVEL